MIVAAALAAAAEPEVCPHPTARDKHSISVFPGGAPLTLCLDCFQGLQALITAWDEGALDRVHVYRWFERAGYPRSDADAFITQTLEAT